MHCPDQTREGALADLEAAIALGPAHLSHYQLTLEPGTAFFHRPPRPARRRPRLRDAARLPGALSPQPALRSTKSRPTRARAGSAGTTSTTGASATTSASARAPTARRRWTAPSSAPKSRAHRALYLEGGGRHGGDAAAGAGSRTAVRVHAECAPALRRLRARRFRARDRLVGSHGAAEAPRTIAARGLIAEQRALPGRPSSVFAS